jgi:hypothetical protein
MQTCIRAYLGDDSYLTLGTLVLVCRHIKMNCCRLLPCLAEKAHASFWSTLSSLGESAPLWRLAHVGSVSLACILSVVATPHGLFLLGIRGLRFAGIRYRKRSLIDSDSLDIYRGSATLAPPISPLILEPSEQSLASWQPGELPIRCDTHNAPRKIPVCACTLSSSENLGQDPLSVWGWDLVRGGHRVFVCGDTTGHRSGIKVAGDGSPIHWSRNCS